MEMQGLSASLVGTGSGGAGQLPGQGEKKKKKKRKQSEDEVEDSILAMVHQKEETLKEDPEFRFRRKPTKKKEVMRGNEAVFEKPKKIATDTQKELEQRKAEKYMFKPQDENIQTWDMIGLVMITYTAFVTPYDVAFLEPDINVLFFFNRIVDLYFICDMVL